MPPRSTFAPILIFLTIVSVLLGIASATVGLFLVHGKVFPIDNVTIVIGTIWTTAMTYLIGEYLSRKFGFRLLKQIGAVILGILSIAFSVSVIGHLALALGAPAAWVGQIGTAAIGILTIGALVNTSRGPKITTLPPTIISKPKIGMRIVHLTDIHLDGITTTRWVKNLVDTVNQLQPDILVFTGDLIDIHPDEIPDQIELLKMLSASKLKLAVSGNHDFYQGYTVFKDLINELNFTLIDDQYLETPAIDFAGISDRDGRRFGTLRPAITVNRTPSDKPFIALSHRPEELKHLHTLGIDLQLSGHTHWGQLPPFGLIIRLWYSHGRGLGRHHSSHIYVSKGTGVWGPPMRLFGRSEIVVIDL